MRFSKGLKTATLPTGSEEFAGRTLSSVSERLICNENQSDELVAAQRTDQSSNQHSISEHLDGKILRAHTEPAQTFVDLMQARSD
jgi:hypothetical protein